MSEKKPEWFEIAENDEVVSTQIKKSGFNPRPVIALAVSGLIIGAGAIFANAEDESPAVAETTNVQTTNASVNEPAATTNGTTASGNTQSGTSQSGSTGGVQNPSTKSGGVQNPNSGGSSGGIQDPTKRPNRGDDDGEFGEHHGPRPGGHGDEHEGREHEGRFGDDD